MEREQVRLQPPDRDELDRTYRKLRSIHAAAFGWAPPDVEGLERLPSNRMRQYVRAWINEWDLLRLDRRTCPTSPRATSSWTCPSRHRRGRRSRRFAGAMISW